MAVSVKQAARPKSTEPRRLNVGPRADLTDVYLESLSTIPLFSPAEERQAARTLRELELEAWSRALPYRQTLEFVGTHERILEIPERVTLETVARELGRTPAAKADAERLAMQLRELDEDCVLIDGVVDTLRKAAWSSEGAEGRKKDPRNNIPSPRQVQDVDRARRAAATARNAFVRANLRLVVSVARGFHHFRMPIIDLIQEGNLGLIKAVHRFDWTKGFRFSTYAHWWIRQSIERAIMNKGAQVRLPVHVFDTRRQVARAQKELAQEFGHRATDEEVAKKLGIGVDKVVEATSGAPREPISLDDVVGGGDDRPLSETVADESVLLPEEAVIRENEIGRVREMLQLLTPVEMDIITRRYGLQGDNDETLEEIGKRYHLSRERVRQIQVQGLIKMRRFCERRQIGLV